MLDSVGEIISEVLVRNNQTTTDSFVTDDMLEDWVKQSHNYCATQYKWPFSEVRDYSLAWDGSEEIDYAAFNLNFKADSIRILQIGGKRLEKRNFEDYLLLREERPEANNRVFSDFGRVLYINPRADVSGSIAAFGQFMPSLDTTDYTAVTVFSTFDSEGNEAIIEKVSSFLARRKHIPDEAELHDQRCDAVLAKLWKKVQAEAYKYQTGPDNDGMFKHFDVLEGGYRDELFNRDQFN